MPQVDALEAEKEGLERRVVELSDNLADLNQQRLGDEARLHALEDQLLAEREDYWRRIVDGEATISDLTLQVRFWWCARSGPTALRCA